LTAERLEAAGVPVPRTRPVGGLGESLDAAFAAFGGRAPLWCRPRSGTCARGAAPVASADEARRWLLLWRDMRGLAPETFTLSEYLPGRDFLCQSLWRDGDLVLVNTFERLAYFGVDNIPSGITSLSSLAKTVVDDRLADLVRAAVRAVDPAASGAFSVDCREDGAGAPRVTEINAGRLLMAMTAFDAVGKHSMALTYARLGLGLPVAARDVYDTAPDHYLVRDLDTAPGLFHADELFDRIVRVEG
jgi:carbamoyl-phosphate synthase large subunit